METKEAERNANVEQLTGAGAIAKLEQQHESALTLTHIVWDAAKIAVMKREIVPSGCTDDEFAIFLERCRRSQMDPLLGEADCVPRRVKIGEDEWGGAKYGTKHVFQVREQGMEARADRFADFEGIEGEAVFKKDAFRFNAAAGTVMHEFDVTQDRGALLGAWARVLRRGRKPIVVYLSFDERAVYFQRSKSGPKELAETWVKMGPTMIRKCARFDALKRAYPNTYGGLTIDAEYTPPNEVEVNAAPAGSSGTATERLGDKLKKKAAPAAGTLPFKISHGGVSYEPGRALAEVSDGALARAVEYYSGTVDKDPGASWAAETMRGIEACRAELGKRGQTPPPGPKSAPPIEAKAADKPAPASGSSAADVAKGGGIEDAQLVEEPGAGG